MPGLTASEIALLQSVIPQFQPTNPKSGDLAPDRGSQIPPRQTPQEQDNIESLLNITNFLANLRATDLEALRRRRLADSRSMEGLQDFLLPSGDVERFRGPSVRDLGVLNAIGALRLRPPAQSTDFEEGF